LAEVWGTLSLSTLLPRPIILSILSFLFIIIFFSYLRSLKTALGYVIAPLCGERLRSLPRPMCFHLWVTLVTASPPF
jgi:hypothetical protein